MRLTAIHMLSKGSTGVTGGSLCIDGLIPERKASAKALTKTQLEKLSKTLSERVGKTVTINATVDESLIGGLVVKVGSKMIDTSVRSKLANLQNVMKEVG